MSTTPTPGGAVDRTEVLRWGTSVRVLRPLSGDHTHREGVVVSAPIGLMNGWDVMVEFACSCWADGRPHVLGFDAYEIEVAP